MILANILNNWLGTPEIASEHGQMVGNMLELVHWFMLVLFVGWSIFFCYCLFRFNRKANPKASYEGVTGHASSHIEAGVIIVEIILLFGFAFPLWGARVADPPTSPDTVRVRVVGEQFSWTMHYPGADETFGRTDVGLIGADNAIGLDPDDPSSKDDIILKNNLTIPVDRYVWLEVTSKDVIHNFAMHPMRMAHDATPGTLNHMWFKPTKTGDWEVICGQLCGAGHANMKAFLSVVTNDDFETFLKDSAPKIAEPAVAQTTPASGEEG